MYHILSITCALQAKPQCNTKHCNCQYLNLTNTSLFRKLVRTLMAFTSIQEQGPLSKCWYIGTPFLGKTKAHKTLVFALLISASYLVLYDCLIKQQPHVLSEKTNVDRKWYCQTFMGRRRVYSTTMLLASHKRKRKNYPQDWS